MGIPDEQPGPTARGQRPGREPGLPHHGQGDRHLDAHRRLVVDQRIGPATLPSSDLHSIVADPRTASTIYVGVDVGVFVSRDNGTNWYAFDQDLPNAIIQQIFWDTDYLYATTYGRGLWRRRTCP